MGRAARDQRRRRHGARRRQGRGRGARPAPVEIRLARSQSGPSCRARPAGAPPREQRRRSRYRLQAFPFELEVLQRASDWQVTADIALRTCSAEDLVLYKLVAARLIDLHDMQSVVSRMGAGLDADRVRLWAGALRRSWRSQNYWSRLRRRSASPGGFRKIPHGPRRLFHDGGLYHESSSRKGIVSWRLAKAPKR